MQSPTIEQVKDKLRAGSWPGFDQDIVAAGFDKAIDVREGSVRIGFEPRTRWRDKIDAMSKGMRQVVSSPPGLDSLKPAATTIDAVAASVKRESTTHRELSGRVAS